MIKFEEALKIIGDNFIHFENETTDIKEALGRILAEDVYSDMDMPPFDKSAMDGFACRKSDIKNILTIVETIPAGFSPKITIGENQCAKIMTGAGIPQGADCVIMVEHVEQIDDLHIKYLKDDTSVNICFKGEDLKTGQLVLHAGTRITSKVTASLSTVGKVNPLVVKKPVIGIIATGDEIIEPYNVPTGAKIRNVNSYELYSQCIESGCNPVYYGIVEDNEEAIFNKISLAKEETDILLLTGGVSMGDFDLVPGILKKCGYNILFDKVAIQPGKPTVFARDNKKFVFGLPGNPVSTYIIFEIFVKHFLSLCSGMNTSSANYFLPAGTDIKRKKDERLGWIPVKISKDGEVFPVEYHGSAHINALAEADGIISIPVGVKVIQKGEKIAVRSI